MSQNNLPQVLVISRGLVQFENKYLFIRRHHEDSYSPDKWEMPGGKLDNGETIEENLIRECFEELGLNLKLIRTDFAVVNEIGITGKYEGILAITILGLLSSTSSSVKISKEHTEHKWLTLDEAKNLDLTPASALLVKRVTGESYLMDLLNNSRALSFPNK